MNESAEERVYYSPPVTESRTRRRVIVVSSDREFAESLRSNLAYEFDVLMARNAGEATAKAQAVSVDVTVVDLGAPVLGLNALNRMKELNPAPIICALVQPSGSSAQSQFDFNYVLARPTNGADLPDRIRFILAKSR